MSKFVAYPAVLDDHENEPGQYIVTFPNVPGAITQGDSLPSALAAASEVLGLMLYLGPTT